MTGDSNQVELLLGNEGKDDTRLQQDTRQSVVGLSTIEFNLGGFWASGIDGHIQGIGENKLLSVVLGGHDSITFRANRFNYSRGAQVGEQFAFSMSAMATEEDQPTLIKGRFIDVKDVDSNGVNFGGLDASHIIQWPDGDIALRRTIVHILETNVGGGPADRIEVTYGAKTTPIVPAGRPQEHIETFDDVGAFIHTLPPINREYLQVDAKTTMVGHTARMAIFIGVIQENY